jgi:AbrB family looped-hinge helix DNA binding protein
MTTVALSEIIEDVSLSSSRAFTIGPKGRVVLPVSVRRAAGIEEGVELVARADGEGRIVLETIDALKSRLWAAMPPADEGDADTARANRHGSELEIEESARARRQTFNAVDYEAVAAELIAYLDS